MRSGPATVMVLALLAVVGCDDGEPEVREWTLVYYLAYDNDLSVHAPVILEDLRWAVASEDVAVVVQVDRRGPGGMERTLITRGRQRQEHVAGEDSARPEALRDLLAYAADVAPAHRYAVFLVGHGGLMGRYGYDGFVESPESPRWMELSEAGGVLSAFGARVAGDVELLHLQQCGRATAETLYDLRGAAPVLLASQAWLGAPNSYYQGALTLLSDDPGVRGRELALAVMGHDAPEMFVDYVAVRSASLDGLPAALDRALAPVLSGGDSSGMPSDIVPTYSWGDDRLVDLDALLSALYRDRGVEDDRPLRDLRRFIDDQVVIARRARPRSEPWCGLSVLAPLPGALQRHADRALFSDSRLAELH